MATSWATVQGDVWAAPETGSRGGETMVDLGLISEQAAAATLGIGYTTLRRMRMRGDGPPFVVLGTRLVRYREADLENWLARRAALAS